MISVTILTKNSTRYIAEVLSALKAFPEVLVYDTGSEDDTIILAQQFPNVRIVQGAFEGFGPTHNKASSLAKYDWILSIDSDEVVTPELAQEICNLQLDSRNVYRMPRHNEYNGKFIRWCGWYPDHQFRLYNRQSTQFNPVQVHESVITKGMNIVSLKSPLRHYSYANLSDFLLKMQFYSNLFAEQNMNRKSSSPCKALLHGWWSFFRSYILKRGILGGYEGFVISAYNAHTAFYKYLKLYEANQRYCVKNEQDGKD